MTLAALIAAYHDSEAPSAGLRATLPLAGRTLVERQARLAAAAGARPIVVLVERVPPDLLAAIDRMRSEGIAIAVARSAAEAADAIHPDDRLLLMADGLVADESHVSRLLGAGGAALLTLPNHAEDERFERIDAHSLWAGLALVDGAMLKRTTAMLGDWDLQSTLLRQAVQGGARQFAVGEGPVGRITIAQSASDLADAEAVILESARLPRGSWISRYLLSPLEHLMAARLLLPSSVTPGWLYIAAAVLIGLAGLLFVKGLLGAGLILLLLSTPLDGAADRLSRLRMEADHAPDWWSYTLPLVAGMALAALGYALAPTRGWGTIVLVVAAMFFLLALHGERTGEELEGEIWLAEPKGMIWLLLPFAVTNSWTIGLAALAGYASASFFWVQRQVHRPAAGKQD